MKYLDLATITFDASKCIGCLKCIEVCPRGVFIKTDQVECRKEYCIECGACQMNCIADAISVEAGTGCASAILYDYLKKYKFLQKFIKNSC